MSQYNNKQRYNNQRQKSILDDMRYTLYAEKPDGQEKHPTGKFYVSSQGQPKFTVYLNNGSERNNTIEIPFDLATFNAFVEVFKKVANDPRASTHEIKIMGYIWFRDKDNPGKSKRSDDKKQLIELRIGRDKDQGIVYLGVIKENRPAVRFMFSGIRDVEILVGGSKLSPADNSTIWANAWVNGVVKQYHNVVSSLWKEPTKNGKNNNEKNGSNNYNNHGGNSGSDYDDNQFDDDDPSGW